MIDIAFVILNFNIYKETLDCINSIINNIDTNSFHIFVVDNASKQEVFEKIESTCKQYNNVTIIKNDENLGFARGNNVGIEAARKIDAKFICCLNNDTLLKQKDFYHQLEKSYSRRKPAVIGPRIILKDGRTSHFWLEQRRTLADYEKWLKNTANDKEDMITKIKRVLLQNRIIYELNYFIKHRHEKVQARDDVILNCCCVIFTPIFFTKLKGFDDRTFMYWEEDLLYISLKKNNLLSRREPSLFITHLEGMSTNSVMKSSKEKRLFMKQHFVNSLQIIIEELKIVNIMK